MQLNYTVYRNLRGNIFFFFNDPATTEIYTLPLHDALPISDAHQLVGARGHDRAADLAVGLVGDPAELQHRSEEHTSELQSRLHLVCRLLLEKKKINMNDPHHLSTETVSLLIMLYTLDSPDI